MSIDKASIKCARRFAKVIIFVEHKTNSAMNIGLKDSYRQKEIYKVTLLGGAVNIVLLAFKFVAGIVYDPIEKEIVEGAKCTLVGPSGSFTAMTDDMGDFWLRNLPEDDWTLTIEGLGRTKVIEVSTKTEDVGLGDIALA